MKKKSCQLSRENPPDTDSDLEGAVCSDVVTGDEIPELKEKERLLASLTNCDKKIQEFECCIMNLHNGKVMLKIVFLELCTKF